MAVAEEKKKEVRRRFKHITTVAGPEPGEHNTMMFGVITREPDWHGGIDNDGYVRLFFETIDGYKTDKGEKVELELICPEGEGFEHCEVDDEFECIFYVSRDRLANICVKPAVIAVYNDPDASRPYLRYEDPDF